MHVCSILHPAEEEGETHIMDQLPERNPPSIGVRPISIHLAVRPANFNVSFSFCLGLTKIDHPSLTNHILCRFATRHTLLEGWHLPITSKWYDTSCYQLSKLYLIHILGDPGGLLQYSTIPPI
jgi:hypothetical protein